MKEKFFKVMRFLQLDALLMRTLERLTAGLTKKRRELILALKRFVSRLLRNGKKSIIA